METFLVYWCLTLFSSRLLKLDASTQAASFGELHLELARPTLTIFTVMIMRMYYELANTYVDDVSLHTYKHTYTSTAISCSIRLTPIIYIQVYKFKKSWVHWLFLHLALTIIHVHALHKPDSSQPAWLPRTASKKSAGIDIYPTSTLKRIHLQ